MALTCRWKEPSTASVADFDVDRCSLPLHAVADRIQRSEGATWRAWQDCSMGSSQNEKRSRRLVTLPFAAVWEWSFQLFRIVVYHRGRRGVRVFGGTPEQTAMFLVASILLGFPLSIIVSVLPIWDYVDDFAPIKAINAYVAPGLPTLGYERLGTGGPLVPLERFPVAMMIIVELIFLINFVALFRQRVRKHALLVWLCYERTRLFLYVGLSGLLFCGLWFVFFYDWNIARYLLSSSKDPYDIRGRLLFHCGLALPIAAFLFGHTLAIVVLGIWRSVSRYLKRHYMTA